MIIRLPKLNIGETIFTASTIAVFEIGILVAYNYRQYASYLEIRNVIVLAYAVVCLITIGNRKKKSYKNRMKQAFVLMCLVAVVSSLYRSDWTYCINTLFCLFSFILFSQIVVEFDLKRYKLITAAMLIALVSSLIIFTLSRTNSQGIIIACLGIMLLNLIVVSNRKSIILFVGIVLMILGMIIVTGSRTAFLAFFVVSILSYCNLFLDKITFQNILILLCVVVGIIILGVRIEKFIQDILIHKWENYEITSGRLDIWRKVIREMKFYGNGINFLKVRRANGIIFDAHNTFFQLIGCFGYMMVVPLCICIWTLVVKIGKVGNKMVYINFFVGFALISMFENMELFTTRMVPVVILFLFHYSMLCGEKTANT